MPRQYPHWEPMDHQVQEVLMSHVRRTLTGLMDNISNYPGYHINTLINNFAYKFATYDLNDLNNLLFHFIMLT